MEFEKIISDIWDNKIVVLWIFLTTILLYYLLKVIINFNQKTRERKLLETVTTPERGTDSERDLVLRLLKNEIPAQTIFHDLYVKKNNGEFSQIDVVVATKVGILVFEVKDFSGWIFGNGTQTHWTKVLAYGQQKYRFYNPIKQNRQHIEALKKQLKQFEKIPFYSIIVFYGDCELKDVNFIPKNTFLVTPHRLHEVMKLIIETNKLAPYTDKNEVVRVLKEAVINGEIAEYQTKHIDNIRDMLGTDRIFD